MNCYRDWIGPRGVRIQNARFVINGHLSSVDLRDSHFPWPVWLTESQFQSLNLERVTANRDINLSNSKFVSELNLKDTIISGQLILDKIEIPGVTQSINGGGNDIQSKSTTSAALQRILVGSSLSLVGSCISHLNLSSAIININRSHDSRSQPSDTTEASEMPGLIMKNLNVTESLSLSNARVHGQLYLWSFRRPPNAVELDGLVYDSIPIAGDKTFDCTDQCFKYLPTLLRRYLVDRPLCLDWLHKKTDRSFQPYSQLASVLRNGGQHLMADVVWIEGKWKTSFFADQHVASDKVSAGQSAKSDLISKCSRFFIGLWKILGINSILLPLSVMMISILSLAILGSVFTFMSRELYRLRILMGVIYFQFMKIAFSRTAGRNVAEETIGKYKEVGKLLHEFVVDTKKRSSGSGGHLTAIQKLMGSEDYNFIECRPVFRLLADWKIHNTGAGLRCFWIPSILPPAWQPQSLQDRIKLRSGVPLKPGILELYHLLCWFVAATIFAGFLIMMHRRIFGL